MENGNKPKYAYFIDNHPVNRTLKISLSPDYQGGELNMVKEDLVDEAYSTKVYRFNIVLNSLKKDDIENYYTATIIVEEENGFQHNFDIKIFDPDKDSYEYNFEIENIGIIPVNYEQAIEIYVDYLRNDKKVKQASIENEEFILNTQKQLFGKYQKSNLLLFTLLFLECFTTKYSYKLIKLYDIENIKGIGIASEKKINTIKNILNTIFKKPEKIYIDDNEDKQRIIDNFNSLVLFFNLNFNQDVLPSMFDKNDLFDFLCNHLRTINSYGTVSIKKEIVVQLLQKAKNLTQALTFLSLIGKDTNQFLEFVIEQKDFLFNIIEKERKEKKDDSIINIDNFVEPKNDDDLNKLKDLINGIYKFQSTHNKIIKFSVDFIEKYIDLFDGKNLDNLIKLKNIIETLKRGELNFNKDITKDIHDNGIKFAKNGQLKNKKVLDFILLDDYYNDNKYSKNIYRVLDIFDGIDVTSLENDFFEKWKKINFPEIFKNQFTGFLKKISSLIKDMKYFGLIYQFYDFYKENEYKQDYIVNMQELFMKIFNSYTDEKCPNFNQDLIKLIELTDLNKINIKDFLAKFLHKNMAREKLTEIYSQLMEKEELSKETKKIVLDYLIDNKNATLSVVFSIIQKFPKLRKEIFSKIKSYAIRENDFFTPEETEKYKFYKNIVDNNYLEKASQYKGDNYITEVINTIKTILEKLKTFDIKYNVLSLFFPDNDPEVLENIIYERIFYLNLKNENNAKKMLDNIKLKIKEIKKYIKDIDLIYRDFSDFFYISFRDDIQKLNKLSDSLKNQYLNHFDKSLKKEYEKYKKYLADAKSREKKRRSVFYNELYKEAKTKWKNNDKKRLEEIEKNFKELKYLFNEKTIQRLSEKTLDLILRPFKEEEDKLIEELKLVSEIIGIKEIQSLEKINEDLILILKKGLIFNVSSAIKTFIAELKVKKTEFSNNINTIINNLQRKKDLETIRNCYKTLKNFKIINDKKDDNKCVDILMRFQKQPKSIKFLFETSSVELGYLQELVIENDSNYVTVNDILDMGKCIEFFNIIGLIDCKNKTDKQIIDILVENVPKKKDIFLYFQKYINNYSQIILLKKSVNKTEALKYQIQNILNGSTFILSNVKNNEFNCLYQEKDNEKQNKLTKGDIISLRERALLAKTITPDYKFFIESMARIITISDILQDIYNKGYPKTRVIKINIKATMKKDKIAESKEEYYIDNQPIKDYKNIIEQIKKDLILLNDKIIKGYKENPLLRYIFGRQFNLIYNNSNYTDNNENNNLNSFLRYVTNDLYRTKVVFNKNKKGDIIDNLINDCEGFLKEVLSKNKITLKDIYKTTIINQKSKVNKMKGVFIYHCDILEKDLFQIYKFLTGNNPIPQNILLCNKYITSEEIESFLYRAILHKEGNSCFIMGGLELLGNEQRQKVIKLLNDFFPRGDEQIESCLILLYLNKSSDIYKKLQMKSYNILDINQQKYQEELYTDNNIEIINADKSGVGKSTFIKTEIEKKGKKWIYFPFGGVLNHLDILRRLKDLNLDKNSVLHIDLYDTDQTDTMKDLLFSILILRFFRENEDIFYLSKDIPIKVEIPKTFINFFEKFPILTLFNRKEMNISNLPPLIVPQNKDSNIQVVANYLKSLRENTINTYDLVFPNITPEIIAEGIQLVENKKTKRSSVLMSQSLSQDECQQLIFEVMKDDKPTYYQINSFINSLAVQLKKFNQNYYLSLTTLASSTNYNARKIIIKSFIELTKHFTKGAYTDLLKGQEYLHKSIFGILDEEEIKNKAINDLSKIKEVISFKDIDPSMVFFHEKDSQSFSIITNKDKNDPEYKKLSDLISCQETEKKKKSKELPDYTNYEQEQFLNELKNILAINASIETLKEKVGNYVFTADNFVKMILILLRIRADIPVIMMGETGCGKTSLIRKLSELKNIEKDYGMKILNIHAGTNDEDIIRFLETEVIPTAELILVSEKEEEKKGKILYEYSKLWVFLDEINTCKSMGLISEIMCKHTYLGKKIPSNVVFIAACNPYRQREIQDNTVENNIGLELIHAKNQIKNLSVKELEDLKHKKKSNLVYSVNPLPHSLLNFVFHFGYLQPKDEKEYIRCIIKEALNNKYYKGKTPKDEKEEDSTIKRLKMLALEMITEAQNYIRTFCDISAVSLREIRRFNIFYEFFNDYLNNKKNFYEKETQNEYNEEEDVEFYQNLNDFSIQVYAINLSIFVCYYMRITNKEKRNELYQKMNKRFQEFDPMFADKDFLDLPLKEEKFIADNIKLDKGIAKNRALLENIFSLFIAINNKVPIFIVGKPGCSKSLSVQLIIKSLQGTGSDNFFFKEYPKTMVNTYQGSMASTSKGVETVFNKARSAYKQLPEDDKKNTIPLIFFDEMGLAEHSPNNPLKVIHAELEYDLNEGDNKLAFIGISNWVLDAAKMNRGIFISIPEPDEQDNKETSLTIGKSFDENLAKRYESFYENLGRAYYEYKQYLKEKHNLDGKEDYHGNRDFYNLVKNSSRLIVEKDKKNELNEDTLISSAIDSIERNFGGIQFNEGTSLEIFKNIFKGIYPIKISKEYDVMKRIKENINDINSRYLLIISESSISTYLISSILNDDDKKACTFYLGSPFEKDKNQEDYALKVLNKIQAQMERGNILILKDLESVYPNLYDLFNQNFTVLSNKKYARLAVGANTSTFSCVNDYFRCIVSVNKDQLDEEEIPFLNRFEKHIISLEYLLEPNLIKESERIEEIINEISNNDEEENKAINYDLKKLLINCNKEEIQALLYQANKEGKNKEKMEDYVLKRISLTFPQDIIINMYINGFKQKNKNIYDKIINYYSKGIHTNLADFVKNMIDYKNIVYTFNNYLDDIKNIDNINTKYIGKIKANNIIQINLNSIEKENILEAQIDEFLNDEEKSLCIIKCLPYECAYLNYMKYFLENKEKEYKKKKNKYFIFIVYMTRIFKQELNEFDKMSQNQQIEFNKKIIKETLSNLSGFHQIFIDNLNGDSNLEINKILVMEKSALFKNLVNVDEVLCSNIYKIISYMKYNVKSPYKGINKDNYASKLIDYIYNNNKLRILLNECFYKNVKDENFVIGAFKDKNAFNGQETGILDVIKKYLSIKYMSQISLLFFKAEKDQFFSSLLSYSVSQKELSNKKDNKYEKKGKMIIEKKGKIQKEDKNIIEKVAKAYLDNMKYNDGITRIIERQGMNRINIILGLNIPGIKPVFDKILNSIKDKINKNYRNNENNLRNSFYNDKEETKRGKETFFKNLKNLNVSLRNLLSKEKKLTNIVSSINDNQNEKDELYNLIINDYYRIFLSIYLTKKNNKNEEENEDEKIIIIDNIDNNKKFLDLMVNLRNKKIQECLKEDLKKQDILYKLANSINWIENYSEEISTLQKIYLKLSLKIPELYNQIKTIIVDKEIQYEISDRNPEYTSIVNEAFFLSLDSVLRVVTSKKDIYDLPKDDFFDLINTNKELLQNAFKLNTNLFLNSKEVYSLKEILKIINALYINKLDSVENIKEIIKYFAGETKYIKEQKEDRLCKNLNNFYTFLVKTLGNIPLTNKFNFYKLLSIVFQNEFIKVTFVKFRELLLKKILENDNFIINSSQIIKIIIGNVIDSDPTNMENNISSLEEDDSSLLKILNNSKKIFLDEVLMNIFETKISIYFERIPDLDSETLKTNFSQFYKDNKNSKITNLTGTLCDVSFTIFEEVIGILDSFSNKKGNKNNSHLIKLYSIVYVKLYLSKLVSFIMNKKEIKNIKEIVGAINKIENKNFQKVIKIYILKLFFNLMNNNYEQFQKYDYKIVGIEPQKEFSTKQDKVLLSYFFLYIEEEKDRKYIETESSLLQNISDPSKGEIADLIERDGIDPFLLASFNKIISNLGLNDYENSENYKQLSEYSNVLFNNKKLKISKELHDLLFLFYNSETYINKMKPKIPVENGIFDQKIFEILLYGFRFCINTLENCNDNNEEKLFKSLLSKDCTKVIEKCLIPGNDVLEDLHLTTLESIEYHFKTYPKDSGCYVCSCGFYYNIDPCGFPTKNRTFNCPECKEKCGWGPKVVEGGATNHGMVIRPGHYRIFKDSEQKRGQMRRWRDPDENIPNILLGDYIERYIDPIKNKPSFGFNSISRDYFENQNKKVRNLSNIGYRLLNLISYYHLFYSYCLGFIEENDLEKYLIKNTNILRIMEIDWDLLKESLQQKNINSIQIFMNMIFNKLSKLIKECKYIKTEKDRKSFEKNVEDLIEECIKNYGDYSKKYNEKNEQKLKLDINDLKTLVTELIPPSDPLYTEKAYPMFKYFILTKYKNEGDMMKRMDNKEQYPLINRLVEANPLVKKLSYLPAFNDFTNYMVEEYSFKISRAAAQTKYLKDESIFKKKDFNNKFKNFENAWKEIKKEALKYKCRPDMPEKDLNCSDSLACFLNDNGELCNGMYLASACQNFIQWQNTFLQPIYDANAFNGILNNYADTIGKKYPVQEVKHDQIVLIDERFSQSNYANLNEVIYSFSERKIFNENGTINYSDYNNFVYDYDSIEEELGKIILPGVCLFEGEDDLNFVTYWGEGFRGGKSDIVIKFLEQYPQKDLDNKEKEIIMKYIKRMNKEKMNKYKVKYDFKEFFGSIQMLIFHLTKEISKDNEKIVNILNSAPGYFKLSDDCKNFFCNEACEITVNKLMNLFFYFEHMCFEDLVETLQPEYKAKIPDNVRNSIVQKLLKTENGEVGNIKIKDLGAATRRLISRYLAGKLQTTDIKEDADLATYLSKEDLWEEKYSKIDDLMETMKNLLSEFKLTVGQAYEFYNIIGNEDKQLIQDDNIIITNQKSKKKQKIFK